MAKLDIVFELRQDEIHALQVSGALEQCMATQQIVPGVNLPKYSFKAFSDNPAGESLAVYGGFISLDYRIEKGRKLHLPDPERIGNFYESHNLFGISMNSSEWPDLSDRVAGAMVPLRGIVPQLNRPKYAGMFYFDHGLIDTQPNQRVETALTQSFSNQ